MMRHKEAIGKLFAIKGIFNNKCVRGAVVVQDAPMQSATSSSTEATFNAANASINGSKRANEAL